MPGACGIRRWHCFLWNGIADGCESPCGHWELNPGCLQEEMLSTAELSLRSLMLYFYSVSYKVLTCLMSSFDGEDDFAVRWSQPSLCIPKQLLYPSHWYYFNFHLLTCKCFVYLANNQLPAIVLWTLVKHENLCFGVWIRGFIICEITARKVIGPEALVPKSESSCHEEEPKEPVPFAWDTSSRSSETDIVQNVLEKIPRGAETWPG